MSSRPPATRASPRSSGWSRCAATPLARGTRDTTAGSRHIPAAVKREVWRRDEGRCAFLGRQGRCTERGFLELHHVQPDAAGGPPTAANIQLRCRAHNGYEATLFFGTEVPELVHETRQQYGTLASFQLPRRGTLVCTERSDRQLRSRVPTGLRGDVCRSLRC